MIFNLIRKDIMIVKGYFFVVIIVAVGMPLLIAWRQPWMGGLAGLLMSVLAASVSFNLAVSEKDFINWSIPLTKSNFLPYETIVRTNRGLSLPLFKLRFDKQPKSIRDTLFLQ